MRPYGVRLIEGPDVADIQEMGSKSSAGQRPGRSGDYHPYCRGRGKAEARRRWKRCARREGKAASKA